jgi:chemotaxis response regulator CheB
MNLIVAIGASTHGAEALGSILARLPIDFPVAILSLQRISDGLLGGMAE